MNDIAKDIHIILPNGPRNVFGAERVTKAATGDADKNETNLSRHSRYHKNNRAQRLDGILHKYDAIRFPKLRPTVRIEHTAIVQSVISWGVLIVGLI